MGDGGEPGGSHPPLEPPFTGAQFGAVWWWGEAPWISREGYKVRLLVRGTRNIMVIKVISILGNQGGVNVSHCTHGKDFYLF